MRLIVPMRGHRLSVSPRLRRSVMSMPSGLVMVACVILLVACSGPGPLPPTDTPVPPTPTPRPTVTSVPTVMPTLRPTSPPTPLPGTKAAPVAVGTANIPLPTPVPGTPVPPTATGAPQPATAIPPMMLGPAYRLVFVSGRNGSDDIFTVDPEGYRLRNLTHAQKKSGRDSDPQWSPDGTQIIFVSDRDGNADIWIMNIDGSGAKNLTRANTGDDLAPRWSPDSRRIAYTAFRGSDADVYVMNRDGGEAQNASKSDGDDLQPAWSPDSTQLVFVSTRNNKPRGVYTVKLTDPGTVTAVANPPCDAKLPVWSPDGKTIAVAACVGADGKAPMDADKGAVYTVPASGGGLAALSDTKTDSGSPVWSPDGAQLAFWSYRDMQQADVAVVTVGSGARRIVMAPPGASRDIAWSPDGATISFVAGDFNAGQIVLAGATGNPHPLIPPMANDRQPRWSPTPLP